MESKQKAKGMSRRGFLKGLPIGIAGAVGLGVLSRRLWSTRRGRGEDVAKGSIFTPAKDRDRSA